MTASIWNPAEFIPNLGANNSVKYQKFVATAGQTLFNLIGFAYTKETNSLLVFKNDELLQITADFTETSTTSFTLVTPATVGDRINVIAFTEISASLTIPEDGSVSLTKIAPGFLLPVTAGGTGVASIAALQTALNCLLKSGGVLTGALTLAADAATAMHPTTLQQVQALISAATPPETIFDFNSKQSVQGASFFS